MVFLLWASLAIVVLGSLYPFDFDFSLRLARFQWLDARPGLSDFVANILLFCPYGFALALLPATRTVRATWVVLGLVIALGVQVAQIYLISRSPAIWDVVLNAAGIGIGALAAQGVSRTPGAAATWRLPLGALVPLICFLAYQLAPFVPSLDIGMLRSAGRRFIDAPLLDFWISLRAALLLLGVHAVMCASAGRARAVRTTTIVLIALLVFKPLIYHAGSSGAGHIGLFAGWLIALVWPTGRAAMLTVAAALLALYLWDGLTPFVWRPDSVWPGLLPIKILASGSWLANAIALLWKGFIFSAAIVLIHHATNRRLFAWILVVGVAIAVEMAQVFVASGSPSSADIYLALALAILLYAEDKMASADVVAPTNTVKAGARSRAAMAR